MFCFTPQSEQISKQAAAEQTNMPDFIRETTEMLNLYNQLKKKELYMEDPTFQSKHSVAK